MKFPFLVLAAFAVAVSAQAQTPATTPDIPAQFTPTTANDDYVKRVAMIPMRDGVKLYTVIVMPKGAKDAPILLSRTPYDAKKRMARVVSPLMKSIVPLGDDVLTDAGYIRVIQDIRGKHHSEGDYVMARPARGPLNPTDTDQSTDAWDTIEWLTKNVPESNGRVGMAGSSYDGFTTLMALLEPHPALKVAIPMSAMVDGWRGDDWFHNGAFRQPNFHYFTDQSTVRGDGSDNAISTGIYDDYDAYLRAGSAGDYAKKYGIAELPMVRKLFEHPAYDQFWQAQAVDRLLAAKKLTVPTMTVVGAWDQEDIYGPYASYAVMEAQDKDNDRNFLVVGPWRHSGMKDDGSRLGAVKFAGDTALEWRRDVLQPFLDQYLKTGAPKASTPPVWSYDSGLNRWDKLQAWPATKTLKPLYLRENFQLSFDAPAAGKPGADEYVSDPAKPVPFVQRPIRASAPDVWRPWLVSDQRHASARTDVLTYVTPPLTQTVRIAGEPMVKLFAKTTGTDTDWVVKLIDVYPDEVPSQPEMGGYQLAISLDIFRGRYRDSLEKPTAIPAGQTQTYKFALPNANHRFLPGHRIMVQIQSSLFPLYDRNPQSFVPNIFLAKAEDYRKATLTVLRGGAEASAIELPVVPE